MAGRRSGEWRRASSWSRRARATFKLARASATCSLHVEWYAPQLPADKVDQDRANSGVFLQDVYEVQVLDTFENKTYVNGQAGAIYKQYPPLVNASLPAGKWQTYDIISRRRALLRTDR